MEWFSANDLIEGQPAIAVHGALIYALTGRQVTRVPLDQGFTDRFQQPYAVTHRSDIHAVFLKACQSNNLARSANYFKFKRIAE
jgi:hypothetical protein